MPANIETEIQYSHIVIRVKKKLDATNLREFNAAWQEVTSSDLCRVILDLSGLNFMDSSGIGAIATLRKTVEQRKGKLVLLNGPSNICRMFEIAGMRSKIDIQNDPEEALKSVLS